MIGVFQRLEKMAFEERLSEIVADSMCWTLPARAGILTEVILPSPFVVSFFSYVFLYPRFPGRESHEPLQPWPALLGI